MPWGVGVLTASPDRAVAAFEKARLITAALGALRTAQQLDERDSLDRESWAAWYDATIPDVRDIKILAGAMEIELHRRRGEEPMEKPGPKPGEQFVTHRVTNPAARKQSERDRALAAQPEKVAAFIQREAAAGRVPSVRGAVRAAKGKLSKAELQQTNFTARQARVQRDTVELVAEIDAVADAQRRTDAELAAAGIDVVAFLQRVRLIPWLAIDRTVAGTTFVIDADLRAICEGRAPRPALGNQSLRAYLQDLRAEITRRRKENHDEFRKRKWNSESILKREQTALLDWIEEQLNEVPN